jgi:cephalosporin hydroxylase
MNQYELFKEECIRNVQEQAKDIELRTTTGNFLRQTFSHKYTYNFEFLGRPIIQYPQDIVAMQEIIWRTRPDLIIETGIAHGGSLIMSATMLSMLDMCDAIERKEKINPSESQRKVIGIDVDIRPHNRQAIERHPMSSRIQMIQGSSVAQPVIDQVHEIASMHESILVCLDSNHTHEHVLAELEAYAPLVSVDNYCVVFDTIVEDLSDQQVADRPWGKGNNPKTAVWAYLARLTNRNEQAGHNPSIKFEIDKVIENKLLITVARDGFLRRTQ